jgi:hypothetical protein
LRIRKLCANLLIAGWMMRNYLRILCLIALACFLASCSSMRKSNSNDGIRQAIEEHLAGRPGLDSSAIVMDMQKVDIKGDKAEADVVFHSRSDPKASMNFHYQLHSEGSRWKVNESATNAGGSPDSSMGQPSDSSGSGQAPSSGADGALPAGHPKIQ